MSQGVQALRVVYVFDRQFCWRRPCVFNETLLDVPSQLNVSHAYDTSKRHAFRGPARTWQPERLFRTSKHHLGWHREADDRDKEVDSTQHHAIGDLHTAT